MGNKPIRNKYNTLKGILSILGLVVATLGAVIVDLTALPVLGTFMIIFGIITTIVNLMLLS